MQVKEQYLSRGDMWRFTRKLVSLLFSIIKKDMTNFILYNKDKYNCLFEKIIGDV
jgi:hypothetical protein